ncbi:MAG: amino acid ABC transporter permease [Oscillospiraceae bacterium]
MSAWLDDLKAKFILNFIKEERWRYLWNGLGVTLEITFFALLIGIVLGCIIAIVRSTHDKNIVTMRRGPGRFFLILFDRICRVYLTVIRGTPVVVQLLIMYYVVFAVSKNKIMIACLSFGINSGAYVAEIIRSGIMSIDNGQFEAGRSLGFNYVQTMIYIISPQALKNVLPALANEFIVLLKETSVAGYVALQDITKGAYIIIGRTYSPFMPLIATALVYLVLVMFFTKLVNLLERRLRNSDH